MVMMEAQAFLCLLLMPGIFASPFSWDDSRYQSSVRFQTQCSSHCTGSSKFQYQEGKTYHYKYEVSTVNSLHGASQRKGRLDVTAKAYIHVLSKCELALTLSDVNVKRSEPETDTMVDVTTFEFKSALEDDVLRFSFQDGLVDEICSSDNELPFALNFKRGVLSAFQNSMGQHDRPENLNEIDVSGNCPTVYSITQRGTRSMQISKTKDLLGCSDRNDYRSSLQSTPFHTPNAIKSLPLLKGSHRCTQTISKSLGIATQSLCVESLVFRPFSKQEAGARTETTQTFEHIRTTERYNIQKDGIFRKSSLVYEHARSKTEMDQLLWTTREKLNELCRASVKEITADVPGLFADLVYLMRGLDSRDIMDVWERVERGSVCASNHDRALKFILDSLPIVGTSASVEVMTEMLLADKVTGTESELWITSFTFIERPDKFMIKQLKRLLLSETHRKNSLLPVTSLVNNFCNLHADCRSVTEVVNIIDILNDIIGKDCQNADEDLMLHALRAIGNIGHADQLAPVLEKCITLSTNAMETRVMAVQAFRGITCKVKRNALVDLFLNKGEDSELRIGGYLGLMQCPSESLLEKVRFTLETEPVNQVGSFVWTHLTNLMETASPHKQALKEILEDAKLKKEFDMDKRKYSRNYEWSYFSEKFGTGAMAESNLIWSSSSFLPRSLMVNLTIDFLGHSVNLLEAGARAQGVEKLVMNYFGPGGVFDKKGKPGNFNNPSRCVKKSKMNNMQKKHSVSEDDMSASFYLRMFGNELDFKHFNEKDIMNMKNKLSTKDIMASLAKGDKISFSHSAMFLDSTVSVPTIAGMVLQLSINGTSSVELKATGKMNLRNLSMKKMEMNFNVRPSGAIQLSGLMTLDAGVTKTGLRMVTNLHSSTAVSGSLDLINGQVLSAYLDTPKEKLEVLDVKSEFFVVHDQMEEKDMMMTKDKTVKKLKSCSSKLLLKAVGYEACTEFSYVDTSRDKNSPYFPFTGPTSFSLIINKKDAPTGFKLMAKYINNDNSYTGHLSVASPGSVVDREIAVGYFIDKKARSMEMELESPWKAFLMKGSYIMDSKTNSMLATLMNDGREYTLEIKTVKEKEPGKIIWIPSIRLVRPADSTLASFVRNLPEKFALDGRISIDNVYSEIAADVNISSGVRPDPIRLQANFMNKKVRKSVGGSITLNNKKTYAATFQALTTYTGKKVIPSSIQPTILITVPSSRLFLLNGKIDYKENKMLKTDLNVKMEKTLTSPIKFTLKVTRSKKKALQFRGNGKLHSEFAVVKSRGVITVPKDTSKKHSALLMSKITTNYVLPTVKDKSLRKNTVIMNTKISDRSTASITKYYASVNLDSKKYTDASFLATMDVAHKSSFTKSMFTYNQGPKAKDMKDKTRQLRVGASISHKISNKGANIRYDLQTIYPIKGIDYQWKGTHEHVLGKQFSFESYNMVILAKGKTIELRLKGDDKSKKLLEAYGNMELNYPSFKIGTQSFESQNYRVTTIIQQTPEKEYVHTINVQTKEGVKHVMVTTFQKLRNNNFNLKSQVDINGHHRSKFTVTALKDDTKIDTSLLFEKENKIYRGQISSESQGSKYRNVNVDIIYPERRIMTTLEGGLKDGKYIMNGHCSWDADKDITKKVEINGYTWENKRENHFEMDYGFKVTTPFEGHTIYQVDSKFNMNPKKRMEEYLLIYGTPEKELSYKYWFVTPMTLERFEMMFEIKTPYEKLRKFHTEIQHKFDGSKHLSSFVNGQYNEHEASATVKISNRGNRITNNLISSLAITSSYPKLKSLSLELSHNDDGNMYTTNMIYVRNGRKYMIDLQSSYMRIHWQVKMNSNLEILLPDGRMINVVVNHGNTLTNMDSSITGRWWDNNQVKLILASKFNKAEKDYSYDITYTGTFDKFNSLIIKAHYNEMNGKQGSFFSEINKDPRLTYKHKYKYTSTEFSYDGSNAQAEYSGIIKYERYPYTLIMKHSQKGEHAGDFVLDASVDKNHNGWTSDLRLVTPFEEAKNINVKGHLKKINNLWNLDGQILLDVKKKIKLDFAFDIDNWTKMNGQIISTYEKMPLMNFGFIRENGENMYNSTIFMEIQPFFNKVKLNNYISYKPNFHTELLLDLPDLNFKYIKLIADNVKQRRGFKTDVSFKYHPSKEIDLKIKTKYNKNKFPEKTKVSLDFTSPYKILHSLNLRSDLDKIDGKWVANLNLETSNKKFESLDAHYELAKTDSSFDTSYEIKSSLFERTAAGVHADWGNTAGANLTLVMPEIGRIMMGFKRKSDSWLDFQNRIFGELNGHELDMDIGLKHDELITKAWLTYMYPGAKQRFFKSHVYRHGNSFMDFDFGGFLQIGKNSPGYNTSVQFSATEIKQALGATFITPHTMPFSASYKRSDDKNEEISSLYLLLGKDYMLDNYDRTFMTDSMYEREYKLHYLFDGKGHNLDQYIMAKWSDEGEEFLFKQFYDGSLIHLEGVHKNAKANGNKKETLDIMLYTPYENFKDIGLNAFMYTGERNFNGKCTIEYMDDKDAELTFDLTQRTANQLSLDATLTLPETEFRTNKLKYTEVRRRDKFTADASLILGNGEKARGKVEFKNTEEFIITVTGPIKEFEKLTITGKYNEKQQRLNGDLQLKLNLHPKPANLEFDILINNEPVKMNFKLRTPYKNFKNAELTITHTGKTWKKFTTQSVLISEAIGKINSDIIFNYKSETDMEGKATLTSSVTNIENLKLGFHTKEHQGKKISHLELGWGVDKEITVDQSSSLNKEKSKMALMTDFEITTPFDQIRSASVKFSHANDEKSLNQYIKIDHNDRTYVDSTLSYKFDGRHIGSIDMRYPRPMAFDLEAEVGDQTFDGNLKINWDKHSPESIFEFVLKMADKSMNSNIDKTFSFKVIHPVRVMGVDCQIKSADKEIFSSGHVTWDERKGKTFSYNVGYSDRSTKYSQMYDGHVKLGVPDRSIKVEASHRDTGSSKTLSSSIYWDADKDEAKKVVLVTTTERQDRMERLSINLNLPYINKQMNMGITRKIGYGSSILENQVEISYSSDPRKKIIITTKIDNIEMDLDNVGNYNYTIDVGFVHRITGIDIQWESHLARVNELSSIGNRITYVTADNGKKVLAFLSQFDSNKKKGEIMTVTPLKTVSLRGDIDNGGRLQSMKFQTLEDGNEALKIEATVDPRRRNMEIEIHYDRDNANKMLSISGNYVNDSALQINVVSQDGHERKSESQIAIRLNSSEIIHTRIQWRPSLLMDMQKYLSNEAAIISYTAKDAFSQTLNAVGNEVKIKFVRISQELRDEMKEVFELMEKEMDGFSTQLESLRTAYRRFYQRNDLYIQDMDISMKEVLADLSTVIQILVKQYRAYYTGITKATNKWLNDLRTYPVMQKYLATSKAFIDALKKSRVVIEETLEDVTKELKKFSELSFDFYSRLKRTINRKLNRYNRLAHDLPMYKQMMAQRAFLPNLQSQKTPKWLEGYERMHLGFQEMLQDQFSDLMSRREFRELYAIGAEIHQQFMYYNMEQNLKSAVESIISLSKNLFLMEVMKMKDAFLNMEKSRLIVYDTERGELQFEIHLPVEMKSLTEPPKLKLKAISELRSWVLNKMPKANHSIWDTYYKYVPSLKPSDWLPPFKASGYIMGSQHILTFDKAHYDFYSTCSHVLARDMLKDSFSVVLNYNRNHREKKINSLCLHFEDSLSLEISDKYELKVNNKETEMPYYSDIVSVIREGDFITVKYIGGLMVVCNPHLDLYKVTLSGWYHGHTAGLLGVYDNEKQNDEMLVRSTEDFEVNRKSCRSYNNLAATPDPTNDKDNICISLFEDNSSKFRPCFKQVDPSQFLTMCQDYMAHMSSEEAVYKVTEQYRFVCRDQGVFMGPLEEYVPCNKEKPFLVDGTDPLYHSADVLFVIEDNKCNQWASSSLGTIVTAVNKALNIADMKNNRFGLLGIKGMNPTVRTMKGRHFGPASTFLRAIETLKFDERDISIDLTTAVRMAMKYPFRPGVAKVLIIAPCSTCQVSFMERNLDSTLKYNGFHVHILKQQASSINDVYQTQRSAQNFKSNKLYSIGMKYVDQASDYCDTLAFTTNGSVFDTIHLRQGKNRMQTKFIQTFAENVGWNTKLPACQKCHCNAETGLSECQLCETNSILSYIPIRAPSLPQVIGGLHDLRHSVMSYISK